MSYQPDQYQLWALSTWQTSGDRDNDTLHALMGLAGEAGEIVDQYKKHLFKAGRQATREQFLDELGDLYYYLRIVAHITEKDMAWIGKGVNGYVLGDTLQVVIDINYMAAQMLVDWFTRRIIDTSRLRLIYCGLISRLEQLNCSIDELAELNRQKLLDGWKNDKNI